MFSASAVSQQFCTDHSEILGQDIIMLFVVGFFWFGFFFNRTYNAINSSTLTLLPPCIWWFPLLHTATSFLPSFLFIIKISSAASPVLPCCGMFPNSCFLQPSSQFNPPINWLVSAHSVSTTQSSLCCQVPCTDHSLTSPGEVLQSCPFPSIQLLTELIISYSPFAFSVIIRITSQLFHLLFHSGSTHTPALNVQLCRSMCWVYGLRAAATRSPGKTEIPWGTEETT